MQIHQILEYEEIDSDNGEISAKYRTDLQAFLEKSKDLKNIFTFTSKGIKSTQHVGVFKYKNHQIEILPKLLAENNQDRKTLLANLLYMLSFTRHLDIKETDMAKISKYRNPFLEILIKIYADSLFDCLKRYIPKSYVSEEDNLNFLKGKLKFPKHILKNFANKSKFYCEYDEFSENNLLNQLFYFVSHSLYSLTFDNDNKRKLKFIIDFFWDIDLKKINQFKIRYLKLTKAQILFTKPFMLAKMFLEKSSIDISQHKISSIALIWDMNKLFEEFIFEFIKRHKDRIDEQLACLEPQKKKKLLTYIKSEPYENKDKEIGNTYVDILLQYTEKCIVLDTKYKNNDGSIGNFLNADIFQMLAYETLHGTYKSILLYPAITAEDEAIHLYKINQTNNNIVTANIYLGYELRKSTDSLVKRLSTIINFAKTNCK